MHVARLQGKRDHKQTEENSNKVAFIEEIKRFCTEEFEAKPGARIFCSELFGMFLRCMGLGGGSTLEKTMFTRHARKLFLKQWPNCKDSMYKRQWCYLNVAPRQAAPMVVSAQVIPVAMPMVSPVALPAAMPQIPMAPPSAPTVYILELEHGRVYVGCSRHVDHRIAQHLSGLGSAFTRMFKPTGVRLPRLGNVTGDGDAPERDETLRYMVQRGIRLVRGWKYALVDMPDADFADAEANIRELSDLCRRCGHAGHFVADCRMAFDRLGNKLV